MANPLDFIINQIVREGSKVAGRMLPKCSCGKKAIPIPCPCGNYSCIDHGFFSRQLKTICPDCAESIGILYTEDEYDNQDWIWTVLDIQPTKDVAYIEYAYTKMAKKLHPDKGGNHEKFVQLQQAREEAVKYARGS